MERQTRQQTKKTTSTYAQYQSDPAAYAAEVLMVQWWAKQVEIAESVVNHSRTMVRASHTIGKTMVTGGIVNWFFDAFAPSITLTTAPTARQVQQLLWKEIRLQRRGRPGLQPKAAYMSMAPNHYAAGYTANDSNAFQGVHEDRLLVIFDEAVGVDAPFWESTDSMLSSGEGNRFLAIYNPTDTSSAAYAYEHSGDANVIVVSALDHPNIAAQLAGLPKPFPKAIDISWVDERIRGERPWCDPVAAGDQRSTDIEWPPGSETWFRPGPLFQSRVQGLWPTSAINSAWSEAAFTASCTHPVPEPEDVPCEIGCDVARYGDDNTVMHVRRGPVSLHHESHNGWSTSETAGRLKELARMWGDHCGIEGQRVSIKVDDDGVGGGVVDQRGDFRFEGVGAGARAIEPESYPNRRSELWFSVANRALQPGGLDLTRLDPATQQELRRQAMTPTWKVNSQGQRLVEPKADTKKRLGRSPDDMDALNLAFAFVPPAAGARVDVASVRSAYGPDRSTMSRFGGRR